MQEPDSSCMLHVSLNPKDFIPRYLSYSLDSTKIRSQDSVSLIRYVSFNPVGKYLAWNFVRANWDQLFEM